MSWMQKLHEAYENLEELPPAASVQPLLPIHHNTQNAQITVRLDIAGEFLRAEVVDKADAWTVIPCTEDSISRAGTFNAPHPLFDKLEYVAGDYAQYAGEKADRHERYMAQLGAWCGSPHAHPKVTAVYNYLAKNCLIRDLVASGVLPLDESGKIPEKWDGPDRPKIYALCPGGPLTAFVRFSVFEPGSHAGDLWTDKTVRAAWQAYAQSLEGESGLCYASGRFGPLVRKHAAKIRNTGDKAKLISANDTSGLTFRGRFDTQDQALGVGAGVSQKAHNALRWLIARQGYRNAETAIVGWDVFGRARIAPLEGSESLLGDEPDDVRPTLDDYALRLRKALKGYGEKLPDNDTVTVMGLYAATTGRLSINYYREMGAKEYVDRINEWYGSCVWLHDCKKSDGRPGRFIGAPSPADIAKTAYGVNVDDKLKDKTVLRLLPCIVEGRPLPADLVVSAVRRVSNPSGMESWQWRKALTIACALVNKFYREEKYDMALDEQRDERNYLFGRLLAVADCLEMSTFDKGDERQTNAKRYMSAFQMRPMATWMMLEQKLQPYIAKLGARGVRYVKLMDGIGAMFQPGDYESDEALDGRYLAGYHCQREALYKSKDKDVKAAAKEEEENHEHADA